MPGSPEKMQVADRFELDLDLFFLFRFFYSRTVKSGRKSCQIKLKRSAVFFGATVSCGFFFFCEIMKRGTGRRDNDNF